MFIIKAIVTLYYKEKKSNELIWIKCWKKFTVSQTYIWWYLLLKLRREKNSRTMAKLSPQCNSRIVISLAATRDKKLTNGKKLIQPIKNRYHNLRFYDFKFLLVIIWFFSWYKSSGFEIYYVCGTLSVP